MSRIRERFDKAAAPIRERLRTAKRVLGDVPGIVYGSVLVIGNLVHLRWRRNWQSALRTQFKRLRSRG